MVSTFMEVFGNANSDITMIKTNCKYLSGLRLRLINRIASAVKMFQPMPVNLLTDGETCFQIYHIFMNVSIDIVVNKGQWRREGGCNSQTSGIFFPLEINVV